MAQQDGTGRLLTVREFAELEGVTYEAINKKTSPGGALAPYLTLVKIGNREVKRLSADGLSEKARDRLKTVARKNTTNILNSGTTHAQAGAEDENEDIAKVIQQYRTASDESIKQYSTIQLMNDHLTTKEKIVQTLIEQLSVKDKQIQSLTEQLSVKDEQIKAKDAQIEAKNHLIEAQIRQLDKISDREGELAQLLNQYQQLHAMMIEPKQKSRTRKWIDAVFYGIPESEQG